MSDARTGRSPEFQRLVATMRARPTGPPPTVEESRAGFDAVAAQFADPPKVTLRPEDAGGVPVEWVDPPEHTRPDCVVLFVHGGGFSVGSIAGYRDLTARIAVQTGATVLSVGYRLAPEHVFPAALDDVVAAYRWLQGRGLPARRIALAGDSAGGGLVMSLLLRLRDAGEALPAGAALISPRVDLVQSGSSIETQAALDPVVTPESSYRNGLRYVGPGGDLRHPLASPLLADLRGLPPVHIQVGTAEILLDDALRLARRLRDAGVAVDLDVWPEGIHILPFFASAVPEAAAALAEVTRYLGNLVDSC